MRRILTIKPYLLLITALVMLFSSCEQKELCFNHDEHAPKSDVMVQVQYEREWQYPYEGGTDWLNYPDFGQVFGVDYEALRPNIPEGLAIQIYNSAGRYDEIHIAPLGQKVRMPIGVHSILFYNDDSEYIVFDGMQSYVKARATTRTRTRASYMGNPFMETKSEVTVNPPDMLYGNYMESYEVQRTIEPTLLPVTMHPLVYTYLVRYEFSHGAEYIALARGAMAGMAGSVYLHNGSTSDDAVTVLFDATVKDFGAQATVRSFGVPGFPNTHYSKTGKSGLYGLNLEVRLKNGKTKSFDFDITGQVAAQPQGGVIVVKGLEITDEEGKGGGSGFDVDVSGWGDEEEIDLPM